MSRPFGSLRRLSDITAVAARHGLGHLFDARRRGRRPTSDALASGTSAGAGADADARDSRIEAAATRFRAVLEDLGPTFIKFGQVLSTREDLLPPSFVDALRGLQDHCPPMTAAEAQSQLAASLGRTPAFASFDAKPIASGSIGQVHRATLPDGREVAVKIQRPHMREHFLEDLDLLRWLAGLAEAILEEGNLATPGALVEQFEGALLGELDFVQEAAMTRRFGELARRHARPYEVPQVHDALSAATVLTMDFVRGARLRELPASNDRHQVAMNFLSGALDQLFVDGLFHADPHPGNFFVLPDNRIALIDLGSVGQVPYAMREALITLVLSVALRDAGQVARLLYRVGEPTAHVSLHRLRDAVASLCETYLGAGTSLRDIHAGQLMRDLFALGTRFSIRLPSEYALVARATATVEGILRTLDPDLDLATMARPTMARLLENQFAMPELREGALRSVLNARTLARELPLTTSQILMDLESGALSLEVRSPKLDTIARNIDALGLIVFMGLVAGGLTSGSLFALARYDWQLFGLPLVPTVGLYLASILFGAALGRFLLGPRIRKVSVGRWLARRRRRRGA